MKYYGIGFWAGWLYTLAIADYQMKKKVKAALNSQSNQVYYWCEEDYKSKWIMQTKQLHTFNTPYQYRLEDPKHSRL